MLKSAVAILLLAAMAAAQQPEAAAPAAPAAPAPAPALPAIAADLEALARMVDDAHRPRGPVPPVVAFRTSLELHVLDAAAEDRGQADLQVQFLEWSRPRSDKVIPLIRYEVRRAGTPLVIGRDRIGPWQLYQGQPRDLGAEFAEDLKALERNTNLARQLIRFLSPGAVLRGLRQASPVRDEALLIERGNTVECTVVDGDLESFPLLQAGQDLPVRAKVYVTKASHQLLAVEVSPLVGGAADPTRTERVLLLDLHERDGLLVPRELKHLLREGTGLRLKSRAVLHQLELRPALLAADFDRKS
jgi:hypothetical protein